MNGAITSHRHCINCGCVQKHRRGPMIGNTYSWKCLKCEKKPMPNLSNLGSEVTRTQNEAHNRAVNVLILKYLEETGKKASDVEICTGSFVDPDGTAGIRTWIRGRV